MAIGYYVVKVCATSKAEKIVLFSSQSKINNICRYFVVVNDKTINLFSPLVALSTVPTVHYASRWASTMDRQFTQPVGINVAQRDSSGFTTG